MSEEIKNTNEEEFEFEDLQRIVLSLDDGTEEVCSVVSVYDIDGQYYIALFPEAQMTEDSEFDTIYVYRYDEDEEGNPLLDNIEDDAEYERAITALDELFNDEEMEEAEDEE